MSGYIAAHYRHTRMGGLTLPIAVRRAADTIVVVPPVSKHYSRSGTHGVFYFPADVDAIIFLDRSNSGHRYVYVRCISDAALCNALHRCAYDMWVIRKMGARDVIAARVCPEP
jgi:hypothetical protein